MSYFFLPCCVKNNNGSQFYMHQSFFKGLSTTTNWMPKKYQGTRILLSSESWWFDLRFLIFYNFNEWFTWAHWQVVNFLMEAFKWMNHTNTLSAVHHDCFDSGWEKVFVWDIPVYENRRKISIKNRQSCEFVQILLLFI